MRSRHEQQRRSLHRCMLMASLLLLSPIEHSPETFITGDESIHRSF